MIPVHPVTASGRVARLDGLPSAPPTGHRPMSAPRRQNTLTPKEWASLEPRLSSLAENSFKMASRVLVDGQTIPDVAREFGVSRQAVTQLIERVKRMVVNVPTGWTQVNVWLPPDVAKEIRALAEKLLAEHNSEKSGQK